jgi:uncharacterized protein with HEPN domain
MQASLSKKIRRPSMNNNDTALLRHIFDAIEQVERYTRGMSESEFLSRTMVQDAVVRQIEVIGEAAKCVSIEYQGEHPKVPWSKMISIRKKIIPEDFNVNLANIWNTVQDDLPLHKQAIKKLL